MDTAIPGGCAMRTAALVALLVVAGPAAAQEPPPLPPPQVVPVPAEPVVAIEEVAVPDPKPSKVRGPLGPSWDIDEYLLWWVAPQPVPPLLVRSRTSSVPVLGAPGSTLIVGGGDLDSQEHSGGRFLYGWALDHDQLIGIEFAYFFLGTRSTTAAATSAGGPGDPALARPYLFPLAETEHAISVARPGVTSGGLELVASTRVQGAEANGLTNLFANFGLRIDGLVGFRFLQVHEGLRIGQRTTRVNHWVIEDRHPAEWQFPSATVTVTDVVDQFDGHNRFYGGQLGLRADWRRGPAFVELLGKVAFGQTSEVVKISGITVERPEFLPERVTPGGVLGLPTNSGRFTDSAFAVVPEATVRVGWAYERTRWYIGYNFLYLSRLARPGDQIDRVLNPTQIPTDNATPQLAGPERPQVAIRHTDFWAQGLMLGWELRY
jgi:hypothetical protein